MDEVNLVDSQNQDQRSRLSSFASSTRNSDSVASALYNYEDDDSIGISYTSSRCLVNQNVRNSSFLSEGESLSYSPFVTTSFDTFEDDSTSGNASKGCSSSSLRDTEIAVSRRSSFPCGATGDSHSDLSSKDTGAQSMPNPSPRKYQSPADDTLKSVLQMKPRQSLPDQNPTDSIYLHPGIDMQYREGAPLFGCIPTWLVDTSKEIKFVIIASMALFIGSLVLIGLGVAGAAEQDDVGVVGSIRTTLSPTLSELNLKTPLGQRSAIPSDIPTAYPSLVPSRIPSLIPSSIPSISPSSTPSGNPSSTPSSNPSSTPSGNPSSTPSGNPSSSPSVNPSTAPSFNPSAVPSVNPSSVPSVNPSSAPSVNPSSIPSANPSSTPITNPSSTPSANLSLVPSKAPSVMFSGTPSLTPSTIPLTIPSLSPSGYLSMVPSILSPSISSKSPILTTNSTSAVPSIPWSNPSVISSATTTINLPLAPSTLSAVISSRKPSTTPPAGPSISIIRDASFAPSVNPSFTPYVMLRGSPTAKPTSASSN